MRNWFLYALIAFTLAGTGTASAASFDCRQAKRPDEKAVCAVPALSAQDSEMGGLWYAYRQLPMGMGSMGARNDEAQEFLADRNACGANLACLGKLYTARNNALRGYVATAIQQTISEQNNAQIPPAPIPAMPVTRLLEGYAKQCRDLGGKPVAGNVPDVLTADFDGDGQTDYLVNTASLQCQGAATAYCGNNGCQVDIALSRQSYRSPLSLQGGQPTITLGADGTQVAVWVDRSQCNLQDRSKTCWTSLSWPKGKLARTNVVRAQP
jgi:hypothetical protein